MKKIYIDHVGNCVREIEGNDVIVDMSVVDKVKKRDDDEFYEFTIDRETINFKIEVINDIHQYVVRIRKKWNTWKVII